MKLLSISGLASLAVAQIVPQGTTLSLNGVNYFIPPFSDGKLDPALLESAGLPSASGFAPITIVSEANSPDDLGGLFSNWTSDDDVWQPGFTGAVVLANASDCETLHTSYYAGIQSSVFGLKDTLAIPTGPYFINIFSGEVHQAYRLYEDFAGAFLEPLVQQPDGKFQTLSAHVQSSSSLTIGVPSRLYFTRTSEKPLAGVRVGVKDLYDLAGVKSSRGNRAWYGLYPPSNVTAPAIQNLIDAGAVIVGTQKLSQFANGENPTADWVDYHAPFNPRGDGYQNPSSSSSGAGASVASYEWLDVAVGSDTGGSIRGPAGVSGIFGNRPTHGLVSLDNVMPMSPTMDTAGFLTRDPYLWQALQAAMYGENFTVFADTAPSYPTSIYVVGFPANDTPTGEILNNFANDLASMIQASLTTYDMDEQWAATGPAEVAGLELNDFLNTTYPALITKEQIPLVREPFYADYAAAHDGRLPFIDPSPRNRWGWADTQPDSILDDARRNKTLFMDWFNTEVLPPVDDPLICSSRILLHPVSTGSFGRRDEYLDPPGVPLGWSLSRMSIFSNAPDSVFPLGEVASVSDITNHTEYLPVTVDIMVARGCDGLIPRLAQDLVGAGILTIPKPGAALTGGAVLL
ncbi:amidase signature domain-containing protein [Pestalotiopsis sp. NC0098]|nr:amidase signature domain-containing protein [Pestalotiopsis sp. NC0098]